MLKIIFTYITFVLLFSCQSLDEYNPNEEEWNLVEIIEPATLMTRSGVGISDREDIMTLGSKLLNPYFIL